MPDVPKKLFCPRDIKNVNNFDFIQLTGISPGKLFHKTILYGSLKNNSYNNAL